MAQVTISRAPHLSIGALSAAAKVHIETIRYYERIGLMPRPPRSAGGHRVYDHEHAKRLTFIRRSRELGFRLDQIRDLLSLVDGGDYTCDEVKALTLEHRVDVRRKIADLKRVDRVLKEMADGCRSGRVPDCPIVDALFESSDRLRARPAR